MDGCVFCMICEGKIPSKKAYEDDKILAFYDINPQAPVHILVIPKEHIASVDEITEANSGIVSYIFEHIPQIAKSAGLTGGYRIISNCGADACQTVRTCIFISSAAQNSPTAWHNLLFFEKKSRQKKLRLLTRTNFIFSSKEQTFCSFLIYTVLLLKRKQAK